MKSTGILTNNDAQMLVKLLRAFSDTSLEYDDYSQDHAVRLFLEDMTYAEGVFSIPGQNSKGHKVVETLPLWKLEKQLFNLEDS